MKRLAFLAMMSCASAAGAAEPAPFAEGCAGRISESWKLRPAFFLNLDGVRLGSLRRACLP